MDDPNTAEFWWKASKDNNFAISQRRQGNEHFKRRDFAEALLAFNLSVCFALPESQEIALAYSNRSAVYFETKLYSECLKNINLARESGAPAGTLDKLKKREMECLHLMTKSDECFDRWSFFRLSYPANDKLPFIVNCLELRENQKYGRHIITNCNLKTGDIIAIENPFFTFLQLDFYYRRCWSCLKSNNLSLIPNTDFVHLTYCCSECSDKDFPHQFFENMELLFPNEVLRMFLRCLRIAGGLDRLLEIVKSSESRTVFEFDLSNPKDACYDLNLLKAVLSLSKTNLESEQQLENKYFHTIPLFSQNQGNDDDEKILHQFLLNLQRICGTNACNIFTLENLKFKNVRRFCTKNVGYGIYPFVSLLNHSCYPNANRVSVDGTAVIVVARPIASGEQIFIAYGASSDQLSKEDRLKLMENFNFSCDCEACMENYQLLEELPKKDPSFILREHQEFSVKDAMEQFQVNCNYIESNKTNQPCFEISSLLHQNIYLLGLLAKDFFCDIKANSLDDLN